jgi:disulfide bond formation protein DsbB
MEKQNKLKNLFMENYIYIIFIVSAVSMFGSLFFQFILNLPPCSLCIDQRYFMYPLVPITVLLILFKKKINPIFFLISSIPGMAIATYHVYLQSTGAPLSDLFIPCNPQVPCNTVDYTLFGIITIPQLSWMAFCLITIIAMVGGYLYWKNKKNTVS